MENDKWKMKNDKCTASSAADLQLRAPFPLILSLPACILRQKARNQLIEPRIEHQPDVCALNLDIRRRVIVDTDSPVDDAIGPGVHGRVTD